MKTVVGLYDRFEDAQQVVRALEDAGFRKEDISLVARDQGGRYAQNLQGGQQDQAQDVSDGTAKGAGIGAVLGGIGGLLVGLGALAIPGIGPVLAAGPIISALAGAGIGAVGGGILGALVDLGIPEEHAQYYAEGIRRGGTLVLVRSSDEMADQATQVMNRFHPVDVMDRGGQWNQNYDENAQPLEDHQMEFNQQQVDIPVTGRDQNFDRNNQWTEEQDTEFDEEQSNIPVTGANQDMNIPVVEEDVNIGKRQVDRGGVRINTYTTEEPVQKDIDLRQEHVTVERRPVDRPARPEDMDAFQEGEFEVKETGEEPVVQKNARVVEEVHVNKDVENTKQTVQETARRQNVDVTPIDRNFDRMDSNFRQNYQTTYGRSGQNYEYYMPAYRFGYQLANNPDFQGSDWQQMEARARGMWEQQHMNGDWEDMRSAVRYAWEQARSNM